MGCSDLTLLPSIRGTYFRHQGYNELFHQRLTVDQLVNASETIYCVQIVFAKLAVLLQMKRLLTGSKKDLVYWAFIVLIVANTGFYISGFFMEIFACAPRAKIWNPLLPGSCQDPAVSVLVAGVFNCVSDVLMLVLPLYAIWRLNIKLKTRL